MVLYCWCRSDNASVLSYFTKIRLKLKKNRGRKYTIERFNITKPGSVYIRKQFNVEVKNRFQALLDIEDPEEEHNQSIEVNREEVHRRL